MRDYYGQCSYMLYMFVVCGMRACVRACSHMISFADTDFFSLTARVDVRHVLHAGAGSHMLNCRLCAVHCY